MRDHRRNEAIVQNDAYWIEPLGPRGQFILVENETGNAKRIPYLLKRAGFVSDLKRFGADRTIETYLRLTRNEPWEPMYKPKARIEAIGAPSA